MCECGYGMEDGKWKKKYIKEIKITNENVIKKRNLKLNFRMARHPAPIQLHRETISKKVVKCVLIMKLFNMFGAHFRTHRAFALFECKSKQM